jgi:hypothetical protein
MPSPPCNPAHVILLASRERALDVVFGLLKQFSGTMVRLTSQDL